MENQEIFRKNRTFSNRTKLIISFYVLLFLLIISVAATYTWFSLTKTPQVSDLSMYVTSRSGLELALQPDSEEWGAQLSFLDMVNESAPLRPVTWSNGSFYIPEYGFDGRLSGRYKPLDRENDQSGFYILGTFYARTAEDVKVSLSKAPHLESGVSGSGTYLIGAPVWDGENLCHQNAGFGAENAIRIGIEIITLDSDLKRVENSRRFFIYEPNANIHKDAEDEYIETMNFNGTAPLISSDRLILQEGSTWSEATPVQNGVQIYTIGDFQTSTQLFSLKANEKAEIRLYLWLEGQDVDCTNEIQSAQLIGNIQFETDLGNGSGLQPIH